MVRSKHHFGPTPPARSKKELEMTRLMPIVLISSLLVAQIHTQQPAAAPTNAAHSIPREG